MSFFGKKEGDVAKNKNKGTTNSNAPDAPEEAPDGLDPAQQDGEQELAAGGALEDLPDSAYASGAQPLGEGDLAAARVGERLGERSDNAAPIETINDPARGTTELDNGVPRSELQASAELGGDPSKPSDPNASQVPPGSGLTELERQAYEKEVVGRLSQQTGGGELSRISDPNALSAGDKEDWNEEVQRSRMRQYVIEQGLMPHGEVINATDEEIEAKYFESISRHRQSEPIPELNLSPAQKAEQVLQRSSRLEKIQLIAARSQLTEEHALALSDQDLDIQVHALVINELLAEEEAKKAAETLRKISEQPYGGDPPKFYAVAKGVKYAAEGQMVDLKAGETVNDRSHDVEFLRRHGAVLHQIVQPDPVQGL